MTKIKLTNIGIVDRALDSYVREMRKGKGVDPQGFRSRTLAAAVGVTASAMGHMLQDYRHAQARGNTRYVIACRDYGRAARWHILAKPGSDPRVVKKARKEQAEHIAWDAVDRFLRDQGCEIDPALRGAPDDDRIKVIVNNAAQQLKMAAELVTDLLAGKP